ncbi:hypothetical protein ACLB1G_21795 [Oxalobacteraceae bacterium A2-2]
MNDNDIQIAASAILVRFLVTQLYWEKFFHDQEARDKIPGALINILKRDAQNAGPDPVAYRVLEAVHQDAIKFFANVEQQLPPR